MSLCYGKDGCRTVELCKTTAQCLEKRRDQLAYKYADPQLRGARQEMDDEKAKLLKTITDVAIDQADEMVRLRELQAKQQLTPGEARELDLLLSWRWNPKLRPTA